MVPYHENKFLQIPGEVIVKKKYIKDHCLLHLFLQMPFLSLPHNKASQLYKPVGIWSSFYVETR